jgi:acyltransferase
MNASRYPWIDHLKALGIFLVVVGHTALPETVHRWIYAFHMPLFFMISGFLISPGGFDGSLGAFFRRRVWKLVKLYLLFGLLGAAVYCYMFKGQIPLLEALRGRLVSLAYASGSTNRREDLYPVVLWFFPGLITSLLMSFAVWKIPSVPLRWLAAVALFVSGALLAGRALPWELESGAMAAGFVMLGHGLRSVDWENRLRRVGSASWLVAAGALASGSFLALLNHDSLDMKSARLGNPWLALTACTLLITGLVIFAKKLPAAGQISSAVAAATILIFPTHTMIFPYVDRIVAKIHAPAQLAVGYGWWKAALVVALTTIGHFSYTQLSRHWQRPKP